MVMLLIWKVELKINFSASVHLHILTPVIFCHVWLIAHVGAHLGDKDERGRKGLDMDNSELKKKKYTGLLDFKWYRCMA